MSNESIPSLGEFLRQERESRGITIEQVASATKIAIRMLHALEADQYGELPAKPFIRGFVTSYARFVGIDPKELLTRFGNFIDQKSHERPTREAGHSGYAFEKREGEQSRTILWFVMGGFMLVGAVFFIFLKPSLKHHRSGGVEKLRVAHSPAPVAIPVVVPVADVTPAAPITAPSPVAALKPVSSPLPLVAPSPVPAATASPAPVASAASNQPNPNDPLNSGLDMKKDDIKHRAVFRALNDVWVRYQVDERKATRILIRKDKVLVLRAHDAIRFQASDPTSIRFNYNGAPAKIMAEDKNATPRRGDLTLFFPIQIAETIQEPFPGSRPIKDAAIPAPWSPR